MAAKKTNCRRIRDFNVLIKTKKLPALWAGVGFCFEAVLHTFGAEVMTAAQRQRLAADILNKLPKKFNLKNLKTNVGLCESVMDPQFR